MEKDQKSNLPKKPEGNDMNEVKAKILNEMNHMIIHGDAQKIIENTSALSIHLKKVSTSQIRNVFGPVKNLQLQWTPDLKVQDAQRICNKLMLLRPQLVYMVARAKNEEKAAFQLFQEVLDKAIETTCSDMPERDRFLNFVSFFEALVAYHRKEAK